ncbi:MAG TPA: hypothetical protein PKX17_03375, partial [Candidatus Methanomethylicus sp.]|nr:hypothetical protein [Candidatus Methanomethylicus sp.]
FVIDRTYAPFFLIVNHLRIRRVDWETIYSKIAEYHYAYNRCPLVIDATSMGGDMALSRLQKMRLPVEGIEMGGKTKQMMLETLQDELGATVQVPAEYEHLFGAKAKGAFRSFPIPELQEELANYRWEDKHLATDHVMALALGTWWIRNHGPVQFMDIDIFANTGR